MEHSGIISNYSKFISTSISAVLAGPAISLSYKLLPFLPNCAVVKGKLSPVLKGTKRVVTNGSSEI